MRLRFGLRAKVVAVALVLAPIPWLGYRYVKEMESVLRQGQEEALLATARAVATALHDRPELLELRPGFAPSGEMERILKSLGRAESRIWIVDRQQRLLAIAGDLRKRQAREPPPGDALDRLARELRPLTEFLLERPTEDFDDALSESQISGSAEGSTSLVIVWRVGSCSTRPTFIRSLSTEATPSAVLISVGHREHSVTVIDEIRNDFSNIGSVGL